jgi:hypothetical protein
MRLAFLLCALALPATAQSDFARLTTAERIALGAEVRALLMAEPEIVGVAMAAPDYTANTYQDEARADLDLLAALADQVLQGADIALFTAPDCIDCALALEELQTLSDTSDATFTHHTMSSIEGAALALKLGMTDAPFYVMSDRILRGQMPQIVLRKYLTP